MNGQNIDVMLLDHDNTGKDENLGRFVCSPALYLLKYLFSS